MMRICDIRVGSRHRKDLGDIQGLARSIQEIGLLHPVVITPDGELIAGQRRLEAYKLLGWSEIPVNVIDLANIVHGENDENTVRKDFLPTEAIAIGKALEPLQKEEAKKRQNRSRLDDNCSGKLPEQLSSSNGQVRDKVASYVGMSGKTYEKARQVMQAAEQQPDMFGDLPQRMDGKSVDNAYKEMRRRERVEKAKKVKDLPQRTYNVIYADPPWRYDNAIEGWGPAELHYAGMELKDICDLPKKKELGVSDNAVLFLWVTSPFLQDAFKVVKAWGFEYKTHVVWVKTDLQKPGSGFYVRGRHELLFICTRGSFTPLDRNISPPIGSVVEAPVREHSQKPEEVYDIIERLYPGCSYIELFARQKREGWDSWGDEAG